MSNKPDEGVLIKGLYLEGARWSKSEESLQESYPKIIFDILPIIWLKPTKIQKKDNQSFIYECPVYRTSIRQGILSGVGISTSFVFNIDFPTTKNKTHWINRGYL